MQSRTISSSLKKEKCFTVCLKKIYDQFDVLTDIVWGANDVAHILSRVHLTRKAEITELDVAVREAVRQQHVLGLKNIKLDINIYFSI